MGYPAQSQAGWNKVVNNFGYSIRYFSDLLCSCKILMFYFAYRDDTICPLVQMIDLKSLIIFFKVRQTSSKSHERSPQGKLNNPQSKIKIFCFRILSIIKLNPQPIIYLFCLRSFALYIFLPYKPAPQPAYPKGQLIRQPPFQVDR